MEGDEVRRRQHRPWRVLSSDRLLDANPWLEVWRETVEVSDGRVVDDYHLVRMPDFAVTVAFTADGKMLVERQYRHGIGRVVLDLPAGRIEEGEEPLDAARRELLEETGYGGGQWHPLGAFALADSRIPAWAHLFLAEGVEAAGKSSSDDLEESELLTMSAEQFLAAIASGEVADICAVAAFLLARTGLR